MRIENLKYPFAAWILLLVMVSPVTTRAALHISVNGIMEPGDSKIVLPPGGSAVLGIWSDATVSSGINECYWALVVDVMYGRISGGIVTPTAPDHTCIYIFGTLKFSVVIERTESLLLRKR
jgi:hypothetical protein